MSWAQNERWGRVVDDFEAEALWEVLVSRLWGRGCLLLVVSRASRCSQWVGRGCSGVVFGALGEGVWVGWSRWEGESHVLVLGGEGLGNLTEDLTARAAVFVGL